MYVPEYHEGVSNCPFCGSEAFVAGYLTYYKVRCKSGSCGACGGSSPTVQGAKDLWNKRPHQLKAPISIKDAATSLGMTPKEYNDMVDQVFKEEIFGEPEEKPHTRRS